MWQLCIWSSISLHIFILFSFHYFEYFVYFSRVHDHVKNRCQWSYVGITLCNFVLKRPTQAPIKVTGDPRILKLKKKKLFNFLVARK
jgi:hypothetical protein